MKTVDLQKGFKACFDEDGLSFSAAAVLARGGGIHSPGRAGVQGSGRRWPRLLGRFHCRCFLSVQFRLFLKWIWRKEATSFPSRPFHLVFG